MNQISKIKFGLSGRIQAKQSEIVNSDFCRIQVHPDAYSNLMENVSKCGFIDPIGLSTFSSIKPRNRHNNKKYKKHNASYLTMNYWDEKLLVEERKIDNLLTSITSATAGKIVDSIGYIGRETILTEGHGLIQEKILSFSF